MVAYAVAVVIEASCLHAEEVRTLLQTVSRTTSEIRRETKGCVIVIIVCIGLCAWYGATVCIACAERVQNVWGVLFCLCIPVQWGKTA